jgi:hypothetical protein
MNMGLLIRWTGLVLSVITVSAGEAPSRNLLVDLHKRADLVCIGTITGPLKNDRGIEIVEIVLERIVASSWSQKDLEQHISRKDPGGRITVLIEGRSSDETFVPLSDGKYLLWLNWRPLNAKEKKTLKIETFTCYSVARGRRGAVLLSKLEILPDYEPLKRRLKELTGKEYDLAKEYAWRLEMDFRANDTDRILQAAIRLAELMVVGRDSTKELNELVKSTEPLLALGASELLKMGGSAQRFHFVLPTQPANQTDPPTTR